VPTTQVRFPPPPLSGQVQGFHALTDSYPWEIGLPIDAFVRTLRFFVGLPRRKSRLKRNGEPVGLTVSHGGCPVN
jgi:hypothetical protein